MQCVVMLGGSALVQQICAVKRKDIRKFLDGIYIESRGFIHAMPAEDEKAAWL